MKIEKIYNPNLLAHDFDKDDECRKINNTGYYFWGIAEENDIPKELKAALGTTGSYNIILTPSFAITPSPEFLASKITRFSFTRLSFVILLSKISEETITKVSHFYLPQWDDGWDEIVLAYEDDSYISKTRILGELMGIPFHESISYGKLSFNIAKNENVKNFPRFRNAGLLSQIGKKYIDSLGAAASDLYTISAYASLLISPFHESASLRLKRAELLLNIPNKKYVKNERLRSAITQEIQRALENADESSY